MNDSRLHQTPLPKGIFFGLSSLVLGLLFYIFVRKKMGPFGELSSATHIHNWLVDCAPSFFHAFAFTCISVAFGMQRKTAVILWVFTGSLFEVLQSIIPLLGTFDWLDLMANFVGATAAIIILSEATTPRGGVDRVIKRGIWITGIVTCVATSEKKSPQIPDSHTGVQAYQPIYMTYDELRQAFKVQKPQQAIGYGKKISIGSMLFISDPNLGIHVLDNSDQSNPKPLYFINLPGNLDLIAKGNILYADSFVDVVMIQIDPVTEPKLFSRKNDVFSWYAYQAIPNYKDLIYPQKLDPKLGVITGVKLVDVTAKETQK